MYVDDSAFGRFLGVLATALKPASLIAYDFKIRGANDDLGRAGRTSNPFRLGAARDEITAFHRAQGLRVEHIESSSELTARLVCGLPEPPAPSFGEEVLVRVRPAALGA